MTTTTTLPNRRLLESRLDEAVRNHQLAGDRLAVLIDRHRRLHQTQRCARSSRRRRVAAAGGDAPDRYRANVRPRSTGGLRRVRCRAGPAAPHSTMPNAWRPSSRNCCPSPTRSTPNRSRRPSALVSPVSRPMVPVRRCCCATPTRRCRMRSRAEGGCAAVRTAHECRPARRLQLEAALRRAIDRLEFEVHFQPRINLSTGRVVGAEALLRWRHPEQGCSSPAPSSWWLRTPA